MAQKVTEAGSTKQTKSARGSEKPSKAAETGLLALLGSMSIGEWAALIAVLATLGSSAVGVGYWLESQKRSAAIGTATKPLETEIEALKSVNASLTTKTSRLEAANGAMEAQLKALLAEVQLAESFSTFAENYINYLAGGGPAARSILIDYVCSLYRESQERGRNIEFTPVSFKEIVDSSLDISIDVLSTSGFNTRLAAELRELKAVGVVRFLPEVSRYVGADIKPEVPKSPFVSPRGRRLSPAATERIVTDVSQRVDAQEGRMIKTITFPGRSPFVLPEEIAFAVHGNRECRVR